VNKNYLIRCATEADAKGILAIYAPYITDSAVSFEEEIPSEAEMAGRIRSITETYPYLVCEDGGEVAGYAYASKHRQREAYRWAAEVSVYVHPEFRGQGVASLLYSKLFSILKYQGFTCLLAGITIPNLPSIFFHEKMGFEKIGEFKNIGFKLGNWHHVGWWELNLNPGNKPPADPVVKFCTIAGNGVWENILSGDK